MKFKFLFFISLASLSTLHAMEEGKPAAVLTMEAALAEIERGTDDLPVKTAQWLNFRIVAIRSMLASCEKPDSIKGVIFSFSQGFEHDDPRPYNMWRNNQDNLEAVAQLSVIEAETTYKTLVKKHAAALADEAIDSVLAHPRVTKILEPLKKESAQRYLNALENQKVLLANHKQ